MRYINVQPFPKCKSSRNAQKIVLGVGHSSNHLPWDLHPNIMSGHLGFFLVARLTKCGQTNYQPQYYHISNHQKDRKVFLGCQTGNVFAPSFPGLKHFYLFVGCYTYIHIYICNMYIIYFMYIYIYIYMGGKYYLHMEASWHHIHCSFLPPFKKLAAPSGTATPDWPCWTVQTTLNPGLNAWIKLWRFCTVPIHAHPVSKMVTRFQRFREIKWWIVCLLSTPDHFTSWYREVYIPVSAFFYCNDHKKMGTPSFASQILCFETACSKKQCS